VENLVEALTDRHVSMPTATIAKLTYQHQSWNSLKTNHQEHFELDDLWRPKEVLK
jgi:phosphohistidine phosphatase SixA